MFEVMHRAALVNDLCKAQLATDRQHEREGGGQRKALDLNRQLTLGSRDLHGPTLPA
jgi:hypothetical protein